MQHNVTLYIVVRVRIDSVEAGTHHQAVKRALAQFDGHRMFTRPDGSVEYGEEIDDALVDEVGDEEHERSRWYDLNDDATFVAIRASGDLVHAGRDR